MTQTCGVLPVSVGSHQLYAQICGSGVEPIVLMHGFPDNVHLYDRLIGPLSENRAVVRFDFLGWGRSDKPAGYPYTATNQVRDIEAVVSAVQEHQQASRVVLVAHDASGPPAIDWALANPARVAGLVLLNTYYHPMPELRRPPVIALYSTPLLRAVARFVVARNPELDRRLYAWQVGKFISDLDVRRELVTKLYEQFLPARPAFWALNNDLLGAVLARRRRVDELRRFNRPVRIIFGAKDRYLNAGVARRFASIFPNVELQLLTNSNHYVQVDDPETVARLILSEWE